LRHEFWPLYEAELRARPCTISVTELDTFLETYFGGVSKFRAAKCVLSVGLGSAVSESSVDVKALLRCVVTHCDLEIRFGAFEDTDGVTQSVEATRDTKYTVEKLNGLIATVRAAPGLTTEHLDLFSSITFNTPYCTNPPIMGTLLGDNGMLIFRPITSCAWHVDFVFAQEGGVPVVPHHMEAGTRWWWDIVERQDAVLLALADMKVIKTKERPTEPTGYGGVVKLYRWWTDERMLNWETSWIESGKTFAASRQVLLWG
jgi:hypothetical protein